MERYPSSKEGESHLKKGKTKNNNNNFFKKERKKKKTWSEYMEARSKLITGGCKPNGTQE